MYTWNTRYTRILVRELTYISNLWGERRLILLNQR